MALGLLPIGLFLRGLGQLFQRGRQQNLLRQSRGTAYGQAMNTQPQGPAPSTVTQAATTSPVQASNDMARAQFGREVQAMGSGTTTSGRFGQQGAAGVTKGGRPTPQRMVPAPMATTGGSVETQGRTGGLMQQQQNQASPPPSSDLSTLASRMGAASIRRTRQRDLAQQSTLGSAAMK